MSTTRDPICVGVHKPYSGRDARKAAAHAVEADAARRVQDYLRSRIDLSEPPKAFTFAAIARAVGLDVETVKGLRYSTGKSHHGVVA